MGKKVGIGYSFKEQNLEKENKELKEKIAKLEADKNKPKAETTKKADKNKPKAN